MKFPPAFLDELRARLRPSEVIKKKVQLRNNGREYGGLCPFHKEKTPSFTVSDEKGFYHCFGCGAHGDIVKFVMETEGLQFTEAVESLSRQAGMAMPVMTRQEVEKEKKAASLYDIMELACHWFQQQLFTNEGKEAQLYLKKRGLSETVVEKFRLGFAPEDGNKLIHYLESKGVDKKLMENCGLIKASSGRSPYSYFRNRIIFPIMDIRGKAIAFGGRILGEGQPKYLNSPETPLFKKGEVLYNEHYAKPLAYKTGKLVVAEGYMDVIAMDNAGIRTAVAPLGTAITPIQIKRLWRMASEPVLCFDGDNAGHRAMERAANTVLPILEPGYTLKFAVLSQGMDPDDYIKNFGVEGLRKILQQAQPLSEVIWNIESSKKDISTPERLADLETRVLSHAQKIAHASVATFYQSFFKNKLWELSRSKGYKSYKNNKGRLADINNILRIDLTTCGGCEEALVAIIIENPTLMDVAQIKEEFISIEFSSNKLDKIRTAILEVCDADDNISRENLQEHLEKVGLSSNISNISLHFLLNNEEKMHAIKGWNYLFGKYSLAHLRAECDFIGKNVDEESHSRAVEFRKQISDLEKNIRLAELAFGEEA